MLLFPIFTDVLWDALEEVTGRLRQGASEDLITTVICFLLPLATYIFRFYSSRFARLVRFETVKLFVRTRGGVGAGNTPHSADQYFSGEEHDL
jgi:hypothetical protein